VKDILLELDSIFKTFLQKDVEFYLNNKIIKSGKFYLFEHGYFNYVFFIKTKTKETTLKAPVPFEFLYRDDVIDLNYKVEKFTNNQEKLNNIVNSIKIKNPSKYYNNILKIKIL